MGPTASGKTSLAVELVQHLAAEIISVDSAMVYRGMDLGTAKPDAETLARAPHHLVDILDPAQPYSAARFRDDALRLMEQIRARGRLPLLVGGTMLYFRALFEGLSALPAADPVLRQRLAAEAQHQGWRGLHSRLAEIDPEAAARIHPHDPQRIQRALEVFELTGRPISDWHREGRQTESCYQYVKLALVPPQREQLRARIESRFQQMLAAGLVAEVRALYERGDLSRELPAMRAVGYRQVWDYLAGELTEQEMVEQGIRATRQYAKRQLTWLRSEPGLHWLNPETPGLGRAVAAWWQGKAELPH
jgi:tRNA dimethylallyltransferase